MATILLIRMYWPNQLFYEPAHNHWKGKQNTSDWHSNMKHQTLRFYTASVVPHTSSPEQRSTEFCYPELFKAQTFTQFFSLFFCFQELLSHVCLSSPRCRRNLPLLFDSAPFFPSLSKPFDRIIPSRRQGVWVCQRADRRWWCSVAAVLHKILIFSKIEMQEKTCRLSLFSSIMWFLTSLLEHKV